MDSLIRRLIDSPHGPNPNVQREIDKLSNFGLSVRFVALLVGGVLFSSAVTVALWTHEHMLRREEALQTHAKLVLRDLVQALETRLALGLPLGQLPDVERLLEVAKMQLPAARSALVVDEKGRVLFSTNSLDLGDNFSDFESAEEGGIGRRKRDEENIYWLAISTDDGTAAGLVLLRWPMTASDQGWATLAVSLTLSALPALAALTLLTVAMGVGLARLAGRRPASTAMALNRLGRDRLLPSEIKAGLSELPWPAFAAIVADRHHQLSNAEQALGHLDEMA